MAAFLRRTVNRVVATARIKEMTDRWDIVMPRFISPARFAHCKDNADHIRIRGSGYRQLFINCPAQPLLVSRMQNNTLLDGLLKLSNVLTHDNTEVRYTYRLPQLRQFACSDGHLERALATRKIKTVYSSE